MQRIPSPFEPSSQMLPSAAGGGSTSTTCCSCCVATLVATVGVPHAVFRKLVNEPPETPQKSELMDSVPRTPADSTEPANAGTGLPISAPDTAGAVAYPSTFTKSSAWGYAFGVLGLLLLTGGLIALLPQIAVVTGIAGIGAYFALFAKAYQQAGRDGGKGVLAAFGVILALGLILVVEVAVWVMLIFS